MMSAPNSTGIFMRVCSMAMRWMRPVSAAPVTPRNEPMLPAFQQRGLFLVESLGLRIVPRSADLVELSELLVEVSSDGMMESIFASTAGAKKCGPAIVR
jgi:hypothetical protein